MGLNADNAVIIDTSINDSLIIKAFAKMQKAAGDFASSTQKQLDKVDEDIKDTAKSADKFKIAPTTDGIDAAVRELDRLNATIENQTTQLKQYEHEYGRVSERYGNASDKALALERKILSLEGAIDKNIKKSDNYAGAIRDVESAMGEAATSAGKMEKEIKNAGDGLESSKKSVGGFDVALGELLAHGIQSVIGGMAQLLEKTKIFRRDLSFLEQNARDAGVSMEYLHEKSGELYAITSDTNEVVEALSNVLASGMNANLAEDAINTLAGAVIKFPETIKLETLADYLQETIATGEATGQYAELLGRLGIDVDQFNERMGRTSSEAGRQKLAVDVLKKEGLDTLWESYKQNNAQMIESSKANYNLQRTYADLSQELEPLETKLKTTIAQVLVDNKDKISDIIDAIGGLLNIGADVLGFLSEVNPALLIVGGSLAFIIIKAAGVALGTNIMAGGVSAATRTLAAAGPSAASAGAQFMILAVDILLVAAAIYLVTSGIAALISAINGVPKNVTINTSTVPSLGELKGQIGYAGGTRSAMPGWRWVGENGPELMQFAGGERVLTAAQSRAALPGGQAGGAAQGGTYIDKRQYVFKVDDIATYMAIERKLKGEQISRQQGWVGT